MKRVLLLLSRQNALVYIVSGLMFITGIVYLLAAAEESAEAGVETAAAVETAFFAIVGTAYILIGIWMLRNSTTKYSKLPYVISIVGSLILIGLYIASRNFALPIIGLQEDIGSIDIISKVLQVGIIAGSVCILTLGDKKYSTKQNAFAQ